MPYAEIAAILESTEANCRQLVTRARKGIREQRQRFVVDRGHHREVLENFLAACASGDPSQLMSMLQQDAVLYSDGGGKVAAALNPIYGADRISRFFAGLLKKGALPAYQAKFVRVNGEMGALIYDGSHLASVVTLELDESGKIQNIFAVSNPEKLPQSFFM